MISASPLDSAVRPTPPAASVRQAKVLVVDDEPIMGKCIARTLRGHVVTTALDGAAALELLQHGELPDLVLCDLMMPRCTGMELYAALERARPEVVTRLVFMTGGAHSAELERFLEAHPRMTVLDKPFPEGALEQVVERALQG